MIIEVKKNILYIDEFKLKCCLGKAGITRKKKEGDKATPFGQYKLGPLYFRKDKIKNIETKIIKKIIKKNMGWCDDPSSKKYNKLVKIKEKMNFSFEKMYRNDYKYDLLIPIYYNYFKTKKDAGSAIFIHLTKNYKGTLGCIGLIKKDFLILLKLLKKNSSINIKF